jgi:SpoVK/Ycf46/Vps4 family AAA+-type ATPase
LLRVLLQALCAEASLAALRRVYPQVYDSDCKLLINPDAVVVSREDFMTAMQGERQQQQQQG